VPELGKAMQIDVAISQVVVTVAGPPGGPAVMSVRCVPSGMSEYLTLSLQVTYAP